MYWPPSRNTRLVGSWESKSFRGAARLVGGAREIVEVDVGGVVGEAGVHQPARGQALAPGQLDAIEDPLVLRDVRQGEDRRLLDRRLVVGDRRAARGLGPQTVVALASRCGLNDTGA